MYWNPSTFLPLQDCFLRVKCGNTWTQCRLCGSWTTIFDNHMANTPAANDQLADNWVSGRQRQLHLQLSYLYRLPPIASCSRHMKRCVYGDIYVRPPRHRHHISVPDCRRDDEKYYSISGLIVHIRHPALQRTQVNLNLTHIQWWSSYCIIQMDGCIRVWGRIKELHRLTCGLGLVAGMT